jgi:hypothetical protein
MEPHPVEGVGNGGARADGILAGLFFRALVVLVARLFVVPVAWPHRRASVPTRRPNATAGKRATRVVP